MIRPPISQVGCASASSIVTSDRSSRSRNGPPEAVRTSFSTVPGASSALMSWKSAECSESTGMIFAWVASASAVISSPPTTRLSLFARARSMPSESATIVGPRPAEPVIAFRTRSAPEVATSSRTPSGPERTPGRSVAHRSATAGSAIAMRSTPCLSAWAIASSPARLSRDADQLKVLPRGLDHLERLHADRAGGAEHDHTLHGGEGTQVRGASQYRNSTDR